MRAAQESLTRAKAEYYRRSAVISQDKAVKNRVQVDRERLQRDYEAFLAKGGVVKDLGTYKDSP